MTTLGSRVEPNESGKLWPSGNSKFRDTEIAIVCYVSGTHVSTCQHRESRLVPLAFSKDIVAIWGHGGKTFSWYSLCPRQNLVCILANDIVNYIEALSARLCLQARILAQIVRPSK